ncbi:threonine/homoserine/homoserine lactone efflux protein [Blastococcus colisei]|uniref:Threonine/homoserine/homoserine lactone efflux protein n=1 Tax=Blastococcus colisei TaxID=1564162 RepID=A0A543PFI4_9ACTN|nr:LysE family translocator [Blastococcus colisei]TQN42830.1 threonine/homoserine/homoserine lactone efflux protein [Blastococcus colisei]
MDGIWAFVAMSVLLSVSPGPDDVLVLRNTLRGGARLGLATVAGVAVGTLAWGLAAAVGLAAVVVRSPTAYDVLSLAGAGYLVLLGVVPLVAELRGRSGPGVGVVPPRSRRGGAGRAFSAGLASDLLSPKIGLFYLAVVPQFVPDGAPALQYSLLLCAVDVGVAAIWLAGLAWLAHAAVPWLLRPEVVRWTQRTFGASLIGLGVSSAVGL